MEELDRDFELQEQKEPIFYHIKFNKSSGPDGISNEILKWGLEWLQYPILTLFNQIMENQKIPIKLE